MPLSSELDPPESEPPVESVAGGSVVVVVIGGGSSVVVSALPGPLDDEVAATPLEPSTLGPLSSEGQPARETKSSAPE